MAIIREVFPAHEYAIIAKRQSQIDPDREFHTVIGYRCPRCKKPLAYHAFKDKRS